MEIIRIIVGGAFLLLWLNCALFNAYVLVLTLARRKRRPSFAPIIGAFAGILAAFILPIDGLYRYWWAFLILDAGTWWTLSVVWKLVTKRA